MSALRDLTIWIHSLQLRQYLPIYLAVTTAIIFAQMVFFGGKKRYDVKGKYCYVTGGSQGLGKALALELVRRGAHVTIVARNVAKLEAAAEELKSLSNPSQQINYISADLTSSQSSSEALAQASKQWNGQPPDHVYLVAGMSIPQFWIDISPEDLSTNFNGVYWVAAWTAHAAIKSMVANRIKGKVVFVSSFLGYASFAGYTPYSPAKYALRGLADSLRSEMLLHDIDIHIYMPGGIDTPGYETEQKLKPAITRKIEEGDTVSSPEVVCNTLIKGLEKGNYQITNMLVTDLIRMQARGSAPGNNVFMDSIYWFIGSIGVPIWRIITDRQVRAARTEVHKELEQKGFYAKPGEGSL